MVERDPPWGLWGGRPPGGWCFIAFDKGDAGERSWGTREEVSAVRETMLRENPMLSYEIAVFDPARDPEATDGPASAAMLRALGYVARHETFWGPLPWPRGSTVRVLEDRGWVTARPGDRRRCMRLTAAGRRVLDRGGTAAH